MGNKLVLLLIILFGANLHSFEVIREVKNDYAKKVRENAIKEQELSTLFDSIKKENNKYVTSHLKIEQNIEKRNGDNDKENSGIYGPGDDRWVDIIRNRVNLVDVNSENQVGFSPLITAIVYKNNDILKVLLDNNGDIYAKYPGFGKLSLHTAAYFENVEALKMLLEKSPEIVNVKSENDGWSALQEGVLKNNVEIVKILLKGGADPKSVDNNGGTPMDMAANFGKGKIVKLLRDKIKADRK